jgi:monoamine oxidase
MGSLSAGLFALPSLNGISKFPEIVVVGGGIAGLSALHTLKKKGIKPTLYEASNRIGGRMMTLNNYFAPDLNTELGGEFIDTYHLDLISLAKEFNLDLVDLRKDDPSLREVLFFGGKKFTETELVKEIKPFADQLRRDLDRFPENLEDISFRENETWSEIDHLSIPQYLDQIGVKGWLKAFYINQMSGYYTMDAQMQSAVNLFLLLQLPDESHSESDNQSEVFKIKGGSQALTRAMHQSLQDQIKMGYSLIEIHKNKGNSYTAVFDYRGDKKSIRADYLILCIPFTKLREVKTFGFHWSTTKNECIQKLGYGNGGKIILGLKERIWRNYGCHGGVLADIPAYSTWDSSRLQPGSTGTLTIFGGASIGNDAAQLRASEIKDKYLPGLEEIWPGFEKSHNDILHKFSWQDYYFNLGSYTSYQVGQWSAFGGIEKEPEGSVFFAGEHCSIQFQGYMNGGAQTGRQAAEKVLNYIYNRL